MNNFQMNHLTIDTQLIDTLLEIWNPTRNINKVQSTIKLLLLKLIKLNRKLNRVKN